MVIEIKSKKKNGHTKPRAPTIPLDQPGRLRTANMLSIYNVCHSTFCAGVKTGRYPQPDGRDGRMPYWLTQTVRKDMQP